MSAALKLLVKPEEYFRDQVTEATGELRVKLEPQIEVYLVNLLCDFVDPANNPQNTAADCEAKLLDQPLVLMLKDALEAPPAKKLRIFKSMGDVSLYVSGYFQDFFNRKAYDINYYITLGSDAYANVATLLRQKHGDQGLASIYHQLSQKFETLVDVVAQVSDSNGTHDNHNTLALYDRWSRLKSDRLRRLLEKRGINPIDNDPKIKQ